MRNVKLASIIFLVTILSYSSLSRATERGITSRSTSVWRNIEECWATVWPTIVFIQEEIGTAELKANSGEHIEYEIQDIVTGKTVVIAGCIRVPDNFLFRRYIEFPLTRR